MCLDSIFVLFDVDVQFIEPVLQSIGHKGLRHSHCPCTNLDVIREEVVDVTTAMVGGSSADWQIFAASYDVEAVEALRADDIIDLGNESVRCRREPGVAVIR